MDGSPYALEFSSASIEYPSGLFGEMPAAFQRAASERPGRHWSFLVRRSLATGSEAGGEAPVNVRRTAKMARLEAVLLVAEGALSGRRLSQFATLADAAEARELIDRLNAAYDTVGSAFRIERVASGYQLLTRPEFAFWLDKLHQRQGELKLSPPAMETLSIVAYRQPITRADIEAIRGVQCAEMLKQLMERGLVRIGGEDDSLGRPYLYETTRKFLELFGLRGLDDLPMAERLRRSGPPAKPEEAPVESGEETSAGEKTTPNEETPAQPEVKLHDDSDEAPPTETAEAA